MASTKAPWRQTPKAIGIPMALLLLAVLALEHRGDRFPVWLQCINLRRALI
jgi:hypothetical protein